MTQRELEAVATAQPGKQARRATLAGAVGNLLEVYDILIYAYSAKIIATLFFPAGDPTGALLLTFAVYAVGYGVRPIGALIFGYLGDRIGRRRTLVWSVMLMAICTVLIGLLPTYAVIGIAAPLILIVLRILQGISSAGEVSGSATFIVEHAPANRRGLLGSFQQVSSAAGFLLASLVILLQTVMFSSEQILEWAWRLPFLLGIFTGVVALWIRMGVTESPEFEKLQAENHVSENPLRTVARSSKLAVVRATCYIAVWVMGHHLFLTYIPTFLQEVAKVPRPQAQLSNVIGIIVFGVLIPVFGALSDRVGRRPILLFAVSAFALSSIPVMMALSTGSLIAVYLCQILVAVLLAAIVGPSPAVVAEMFPTAIRFSAMSLGWNISAMLFGGVAPLMATLILAWTGLSWSAGFIAVFCALLTLLVVLRMPETAGKPLS